MVNVIRINGVEMVKAPVVPEVSLSYLYDQEARMMEFVQKLGDFMKYVGIPGALVGSFMNASASLAHAAPEAVVTVAAAAAKNGLWYKFLPLVRMVQDFALPVGVVVATWGLIEIIMGNLGAGKEKVKYSIIGYIGVYVIPMVFEAIGGAFRA